MDTKILEFVNALRASGVRVTLSESIDCFRALEILGLDEKRAFKAALRSTLVKRAADIPSFDRLFEIYFTSLVKPLPAENEEESDVGMLKFAETTVQEFLYAFSDENRAEYEMLAQLLAWQIGGDFELAMMESGQLAGVSDISNPLQVGFFSRKMRDSLGWNVLAEEVEELMRELAGQGYSPEEVARVAEFIRRRMDRFAMAIKEFVRNALEKNMQGTGEKLKEEELLNKNFYLLSQREIDTMRDIVARLGKKMKDKLLVRQKRRNRGRIDVKRVIRRNLQYGGVPMELCYKNRRREKPQIFALCDVSDSVGYAARFMLQFLYTLQELFTKVRTFVFVTEIAEVTRLFDEHEINAAIQLALHSRLVDYNGHSNFGYAFHQFRNEFLESVTPRTTVIVIGDARNNRNDPRVWAFREIREKAKRVIWLNPEARAAWRLGDSVMYDYLPFCEEVHECRNARQLIGVVDKLIAK
ncbi:MAG: VWA domain-containing protein [Candidatus Lindowbacteria bacterium]|nr:VWA domain-containing protein [Candidatus Lindowbacteria bacterium]